jgi:2-phosphosulfolactate phosphatase
MTVAVRIAGIREVLEKGVRGCVMIAIDVLRTCSSVIAAISNECLGIIPLREVKEALDLKKRYKKVMLAGERRGLKPRGFDLGNSPLEFRREVVKGRLVALTTTNGCKLLSGARGAERVLIGAFLNSRLVAERALEEAEAKNRDILLGIAGRMMKFSLEDFICAGIIAMRLSERGVRLSDKAYASMLCAEKALEDLQAHVMNSIHAKYLKEIRREEDVRFCCNLDSYEVVPILVEDRRFPYGIILGEEPPSPLRK